MPSVLDNVDSLRARQRAYQSIFNSPIGQEVVADLAKFCRAWETCFHKDARIHAALEGRREVFLRIVQHLNLTTDQLLALYRGQSIQIEQQEAPAENE